MKRCLVATDAANSLMTANAHAHTAARLQVASAALATAEQQADKPHFAHIISEVKKIDR
jgi:hypothetical protein